MKTSSTSASHRERKRTESSVERAEAYAAAAIAGILLRKYYETVALTNNLPNARFAAMQDYLKHEQEFQELNKPL